MGLKHEWRTQEEVYAAALDLQKAAEGLLALSIKMTDNKFPKAIFLWTQATFNAISDIVDLPKISDVMMDNQIKARKQGVKSKYEKAMEKSKKDIERRKAKAEPIKPVGRPRKNPG